MKRFTQAIVFLFILIPAAAHAIPCEQIILDNKVALKDAIDIEFNNALENTTLSFGFYKRLKLKFLRNRVLKECMPFGCTQEQIATLVQQSIEQSLMTRNARGYAFLIGGIMTNALVLTGITLHYEHHAEFVPKFVEFVLEQTAFVGAAILAPFAKPVAHKIKSLATNAQTTVSSLVDLKEQKVDEEDGEEFGPHHFHFLEEEPELKRSIFEFRSVVWQNFQTAKQELEKGDADSVAFLIADAAMNGYRYFKKYDPADPTIVNAVRVTFRIDRVSDKDEIKKRAIERIAILDPNASLKAKAYYERAISAWLSLEVDGLNLDQK